MGISVLRGITGKIIDLANNVFGVLPIANGGTGASDVATARNNLGLKSAATYDVNVANGVVTYDNNNEVHLNKNIYAFTPATANNPSWFGGKADGGWQGIAIANSSTADNTSVFIDHNIGNVMVGGSRSTRWSDGSVDYSIAVTAAGDKTTRRDTTGMTVKIDYVWTSAYGYLHGYFARLDNTNQTIKTGAIQVGVLSPTFACKRIKSTFQNQTQFNIAHGLDSKKILSCDVRASNKDNADIVLFSQGNWSDDFAFNWYVDGTNVVIAKRNNNSANLIGSEIQIFIIYEV